MLERGRRTTRASLMQVFQRQRSVLGGMDEAIAVLRLCSGRRGGGGAMGARLGRAGGARALRRRRDRAVGDGADDRGRLLPVLPPRDGVPRRPRAAHADRRATCARWSRPPAASRSCTSRPGTTTGTCRPATAGRRTSRARSASRPTPRPRGGAARASGTVPHGLIAAYGGDTVRAARALRRPLRRRARRHRAGGLRERLRAHGARGRRRAGDRLWGVRLDTSHTMVDRSLWHEMGRFDPPG